jgi:ubiquinone/menaquinone biosynthesis C-methylase UbiE
MMDLADILPGQHVLNVATGIGEPAITAARLVGPVGQVHAIDIAAPMLVIARARAMESGLHNITFREMEAEALDLPEQSFDSSSVACLGETACQGTAWGARVVGHGRETAKTKRVHRVHCTV